MAHCSWSYRCLVSFVAGAMVHSGNTIDDSFVAMVFGQSDHHDLLSSITYSPQVKPL